MSREGTVEVSHVWKRFRRDRGRRLLRDQMQRVQHTVRRKEAAVDPWRWVLRDIDFEVTPGEAVGVIGVNGAGKSTLLKIISGVMFPHSGRVNVEGRVGALLEVASGIHPELTGRENVNIFGTLLGFSKKDISSRFDEIIAFAELEDAVDRQTKFYSSGMKTRLGFGIAAFLEPEVLIVDEVLAVGDQLFQQKCLDRMRQVLDSGSTLMLVSHDLASVGATASRGIWLADGCVRADGPIDDVLAAYRREIEERSSENRELAGQVRVFDLKVSGPDGGRIETLGDAVVDFVLDSDVDRWINVFVGVSQGPATPIFVLNEQMHLSPGRVPMRLTMKHLPLPAGAYYLWFAVRDPAARRDLTAWQPMGSLMVQGSALLDPVPRAIVRLAPVYIETEWERREVAPSLPEASQP